MQALAFTHARNWSRAGADERVGPEGRREWLLVLTYAPRGSLQSQLRMGTIDWAGLCRMAQSITRALAFLHGEGGFLASWTSRPVCFPKWARHSLDGTSLRVLFSKIGGRVCPFTLIASVGRSSPSCSGARLDSLGRKKISKKNVRHFCILWLVVSVWGLHASHVSYHRDGSVCVPCAVDISNHSICFSRHERVAVTTSTVRGRRIRAMYSKY